MEVSPFLSVSSFYFTPIFLLAFLLIQTLSKLVDVDLIPFFLFFFICPLRRVLAVFYSANIKDGPIVCADWNGVLMCEGWLHRRRRPRMNFGLIFLCVWTILRLRKKKENIKKKIHFVFWKKSWHYHLLRCFTTSVPRLCCSKYSHGRSKKKSVSFLFRSSFSNSIVVD